jgi:hypothetical protein
MLPLFWYPRRMAGPISPKEVASRKEASIPDEVFEVFNDLISQNWDGHRATVSQDDAVRQIAKKMGVSRGEAFNKGWLDVEDSYRKKGWKVEYDKPGYNESYSAFFVFKKK